MSIPTTMASLLPYLLLTAFVLVLLVRSRRRRTPLPVGTKLLPGPPGENACPLP